ncbi:MAG: M48 family metallopeptidase [Proteobacteria bacterium]|nr:M48 family metallopeptidase [Pseudomonadota bacterium]
MTHAAPCSTRRVTLCGQAVEYRLVRARRRSIGMEVDLDGLTVRAPRWVGVREIDGALAERAAWIVRTLGEWRGRRREVMPRRWESGAPIVYRGEALTLELHAARSLAIAADLFHLVVRHPRADDEKEVADGVRRWFREQAWALVATRVAAYAARIDRTPAGLRLSNARGEWGSCNARGEIRLNWRLVQLPPQLAEYVVAHEVAHIVELNHSRRFWTVVGAMLPDYAVRRRELDDWTALLAA